jgi:hypothetical protein
MVNGWHKGEPQPRGPSEGGNMAFLMDFAGLAGAIGVSVALALWIEWVSLRGLLRWMPVPTAGLQDFAVHSSERNYPRGKQGGVKRG